MKKLIPIKTYRRKGHRGNDSGQFVNRIFAEANPDITTEITYWVGVEELIEAAFNAQNSIEGETGETEDASDGNQNS